MTENIENLILEHLRAMRAEIADLKSGLAGIQLQVSALGQQIAGLTTAVYGGHAETDELKRRIERIERRLDLREETP